MAVHWRSEDPQFVPFGSTGIKPYTTGPFVQRGKTLIEFEVSKSCPLPFDPFDGGGQATLRKNPS